MSFDKMTDSKNVNDVLPKRFAAGPPVSGTGKGAKPEKQPKQSGQKGECAT